MSVRLRHERGVPRQSLVCVSYAAVGSQVVVDGATPLQRLGHESNIHPSTVSTVCQQPAN